MILHPFFFASYAILAFIAYNSVQSISGLRALIISLAVALVIFISFLVITKDSRKAGLISSVCILMIFSFGHIKGAISNVGIIGEIFSKDYVLLPILLLIAVVWIVRVIKTQGRHLGVFTMYFNIVGIILIVFPISQVLISSVRSDTAKHWINEYIALSWEKNGGDFNDNQSEIISHEEFPDIYYILLDSYARSDVLAELYEYDNSYFVNFLEEKGFYIAEDSNSNYKTTELSISSSLNMKHINDMPDYYNRNITTYDSKIIVDTAVELVSRNKVSQFLKNRGYKIVEFESVYDKIHFSSSDVNLRSPNIQQVNTNQTIVEEFLLDSSLARLFISSEGKPWYKRADLVFDNHREQVLYALDYMASFAGKDGNYFVFSHLVSPHTPYVFGPNCEKISNQDPYTLTDMRIGNEKHITYYRDQVHCLNQLLSNAVEEIFKNSSHPPIIIIQSDHGSRVYSEKDPEGSIQEQLDFQILNAYFLPDNDYKMLYSSITPVNSFRVIFNKYFWTDFSLLNDNSYSLVNREGKLIFIHACEYYGTCFSD